MEWFTKTIFCSIFLLLQVASSYSLNFSTFWWTLFSASVHCCMRSSLSSSKFSNKGLVSVTRFNATFYYEERTCEIWMFPKINQIIELTWSFRTFVSFLFVLFPLWLICFTFAFTLCSIASNCHLTNSLSSCGVSTIALISLMTFKIKSWNKII